MSAKVVKCYRCGKRHRGQDGWNEDYVAGLVIGHLCPDCQSSEENLGAEVNLVLNPPSDHRAVKMKTSNDTVKLIMGLINVYPNEGLMRSKADLLEQRRKDSQAFEMVRLMRTIADAMESGELLEED
jgi:hypothetical protein